MARKKAGSDTGAVAGHVTDLSGTKGPPVATEVTPDALRKRVIRVQLGQDGPNVAMWPRDGIAKAAEEVAKHARLVEHVEALQVGQKEMAKAIAALGDRMTALEAELRAARAEIKLDAVKETQQILNSVQGGFYDKLSDLSAKVSQLQHEKGGSPDGPIISLPKTKPQNTETDTAPRA